MGQDSYDIHPVPTWLKNVDGRKKSNKTNKKDS